MSLPPRLLNTAVGEGEGGGERLESAGRDSGDRRSPCSRKPRAATGSPCWRRSLGVADLAAVGRLNAVGVEGRIDRIGSGGLDAVVRVVAEIDAVVVGDVVVRPWPPAAIRCSGC